MKNRTIWLILAILVVIVVVVITLQQSLKRDESVKIGAILPLTGNLAFVGENFKNGLTIASQEKFPPHVKFAYEDSKGDPKEAVTILNKVLADKSFKIVVSTLSSVTDAIIPIVSNSKSAILMASLTSKSDVTKSSPYIFRYFLTSQDEVGTMNSFFKSKGINSISVIYLNDDYGKDAVTILHKVFQGKIVYEDTFSSADKDFKNLVLKAKNSPNLYLLGYGPAYGLLVKQFRELGYKGTIYGVSSLASPTVLNVAGDAAKGAIFTGTTFDPANPSTEKAKSFVDLYKSKFNKIPDHYAAYGYDVASILAVGLQSKPTSLEQLRTNLFSIGTFDGIFGKSTLDNFGDFHFDVRIYVISQDRQIIIHQ